MAGTPTETAPPHPATPTRPAGSPAGRRAPGLLGALAAAVVAGRDWTARPLAAGLTCGGFALLAAGAGAAAESGATARLWRRLPRVLRDAVRTGLVAALLVLGAGAAVAGVTV